MAKTTQNSDLRRFLEEKTSVIIGSCFNCIPEGITRWAAVSWNTEVPESEMGRLLGNLQKIYRKKAKTAPKQYVLARN